MSRRLVIGAVILGLVGGLVVLGGALLRHDVSRGQATQPGRKAIEFKDNDGHNVVVIIDLETGVQVGRHDLGKGHLKESKLIDDEVIEVVQHEDTPPTFDVVKIDLKTGNVKYKNTYHGTFIREQEKFLAA